MGTYKVTLGEKKWTAGHCHKCAHMELSVHVRAASRAAAVEQVKENLLGQDFNVRMIDRSATLSITPDASLFTGRSVKVEEVA